MDRRLRTLALKSSRAHRMLKAGGHPPVTERRIHCARMPSAGAAGSLPCRCPRRSRFRGEAIPGNARLMWSRRPNPRSYPKARRELLAPVPTELGLQYEAETLAPGASREQIAYQLVACGADILSALRYPDAITTTSRKIATATAKSVADAFGRDSGRRAARFMAASNAVWNIEMQSLAGEDGSASVHRALSDLLDQIFPMAAQDIEELDLLRGEYHVIYDHNIAGRHPATGWYMALLDPEFAEGRDVDTDPQLQEVQRRYASRYLRLGAERRAIAICLGDDAYESVAASLLPSDWPGYEILAFDSASLSWWTNCAEGWRDCGLRALETGLVPARDQWG